MGDFAAYIMTAFALVFVIEGMLYALFPNTMHRIMAIALVMPQASLRRFGAIMVAAGFLLVYLIDVLA